MKIMFSIYQLRAKMAMFESFEISVQKYFSKILFAILNCYNLVVCAPAGALNLHAQIFLGYLNILIINWPLLRALKIVNQKFSLKKYIF